MLTLFVLILSASVFAEDLTEIDICKSISVQDKITPVSDSNVRLIVWKPGGSIHLQDSLIRYNFQSLKSVCSHCFDANGVSKEFTKELKDYYPTIIGAYRFEKNQYLSPWTWDDEEDTVIESLMNYTKSVSSYGPMTSNDTLKVWSIIVDKARRNNTLLFEWSEYLAENVPQFDSKPIYFACQRPFRPHCHTYKRYNWEGCELIEEYGCHSYYTTAVLDGDSAEGACSTMNDTMNKIFVEQCPDEACICKTPVTKWSEWSRCTAKKCSDKQLQTRTRSFLKKEKCSQSHLRLPLMELRNCSVENCNLLKPMKLNIYDYDDTSVYK